ncbi:hemerythrin domain-containing protein [Streptomyces sp. ST1020]|uniref:hemerythrin domain-containing protein n=1 Tax=Streptomyces sp. ST1020 TaxID=1848901 RepID=UPI0034C645BC
MAPATRELVTAERKRAADRPRPARRPDSAGRANPVEGSHTTPPERAATATLAPDQPRTSTPGDRLSVQPTPPPSTRQSTERLWDESSRPTAPPADPQRGYSRREQEPARNLVAAHDQLRADLDRLGEVVRQVLDDALDPGEARSEIQRLSLRQNAWTLGAYCASYCRVTTVHHTREDEDLFPHLRRSDPRLGAVLDRLTEEHHAIQGVIERLDRALVAFVREEQGGEALRAATDLLTDTLLSHLAYEERELIEPMARYGTGW